MVVSIVAHSPVRSAVARVLLPPLEAPQVTPREEGDGGSPHDAEAARAECEGEDAAARWQDTWGAGASIERRFKGGDSGGGALGLAPSACASCAGVRGVALHDEARLSHLVQLTRSEPGLAPIFSLRRSEISQRYGVAAKDTSLGSLRKAGERKERREQWLVANKRFAETLAANLAKHEARQAEEARLRAQRKRARQERRRAARELAALTIQTPLRSFIARRRVAAKRRQRELAATTIQTKFRDVRTCAAAKVRARELRHERAVTKVQSFARGYLGRKAVARRRLDLSLERVAAEQRRLDEAAAKVQKVVRGRTSRRRVAALIDERNRKDAAARERAERVKAAREKKEHETEEAMARMREARRLRMLSSGAPDQAPLKVKGGGKEAKAKKKA
jgi:hypothetical protein